MNREGLRRVIALVVLLAAAMALLLVVRFVLGLVVPGEAGAASVVVSGPVSRASSIFNSKKTGRA